jgi:hypothetical protein
MTRNVEHLFMWFLPFGLLPLKKLCSVLLLISSLSHWFLEEFSLLSSLYILIINLLSDV